MKNIHILPTDKPSRLHFDSKLFLSPNYQDSKTINSIVEGRNIYITSDEDVKDGEWCYYENGNLKGIHKVVNGQRPKTMFLKKIILTTDGDLINDGVQAIDDEFLEWFVKNPSCEEVDVKDIRTIPALQLGSPNGHLMYKIIIPREEPKPHSFCETPEEKCTMNYCDDNGCQNRRRELVESVVIAPAGIGKSRLHEQETIEEVAERLTENAYQNEEWETGRLKRIGYYQGLIEGAKLQAERMYSEEEVLDLLYKRDLYLFNRDEEIELELPEDWFEQFKKK